MIHLLKVIAVTTGLSLGVAVYEVLRAWGLT